MRSEIFIKELLQHWKTKEPDLVAKGITTILELILEGSEWHDASKEQPETDFAMLVFTTDCVVLSYDILRYNKNGFWHDELHKRVYQNDGTYVTAWKELSEPPKFEEE